jgi:hypothetical protein
MSHVALKQHVGHDDVRVGRPKPQRRHGSIFEVFVTRCSCISSTSTHCFLDRPVVRKRNRSTYIAVHHCCIMMKLTVWLLTVAHCAAFAPAVRAPASTTVATQAGSTSALFSTKQVQTKRREGGVADELGIPCEGECEISRYPNLPDSVHPGVLSGQALIDLLQDAKTKGTPTVSLDLN